MFSRAESLHSHRLVMCFTVSSRQEEADRTVFVGNLHSSVKEELLYELFLQAGPLTKVKICKDKDGNPKPFAFVSFKHTESVSYAIALLNDIRLYGRPIKLQYRLGSSHLAELNSPPQSLENANGDPSTHSHEWPSGSFVFPPPSGSMGDVTLPPPPPFYFQGMVNNYVTQQCGPMVQQPYFHIPQQTPNWPMIPYANSGQDLLAGPNPMESVSQNQRACELYPIGQSKRKRKRQLQTSENDSDSSSEKRSCGTTRKNGHKYRKYNAKKR